MTVEYCYSKLSLCESNNERQAYFVVGLLAQHLDYCYRSPSLCDSNSVRHGTVVNVTNSNNQTIVTVSRQNLTLIPRGTAYSVACLTETVHSEY